MIWLNVSINNEWLTHVAQFHSVLAIPSSPGLSDPTESSPPINQQSDSSLSREQKTGDITQSAELATAIVEDDSENRPVSVFLDHSGNLSFTHPLHPVNEAPIKQSFGDNTLLAGSSTFELHRTTKNRDDVAAVTSRVTRSNNIAPQIVQNPPTSKPKKESVPIKNQPAVKRHANLQIPQTTILDAQLHDVISGQGYSASPIDVDNFHESKETVPLLKTQKRRLAAAGTIIREVTKPLDEARRLEDSSLKINISPVVLKPESKKRSSRNMEESEVIHSSDQERPTKRARIDPERPSHPVFPYQRKKYGRNGRISSPRAESPAVPTFDFDEIPEPEPNGAVKHPKPRASAMKGKRVGKKTRGGPAAPKKGHQDVKVDVKPTAPKVPVSLAKAKQYNQARESFSKIDHHVRQLSLSPQFR